MTEKEFNTSLMAPVQLSLSTSKMAVEKAGNQSLKVFAGFEIAELIALNTVLTGLGTLIPEMKPEDKDLFTAIEATGPDDEFDKLYVKAQVKNHRLLRDLTEDYLGDAPTSNLDVEEAHSKDLATLAMAFFKEHLANAETISRELGISDSAL